MKRTTLTLILDEILDESSKIKRLKNRLAKATKNDQKDELLGEINAAVFHLKTHCTLLDKDLSEIRSWVELEKK
jgi:hypothetical protein